MNVFCSFCCFFMFCLGYSGIDVASAVMSSLRKVWNNCRLCVDTKVHVYRALVQSVLLHRSQTWTLLASDIKKLEAFHLRCQRITTLCQLAGTRLLMRRYANRQNWRHSQNSYREGVRHYLVISLDLTQLSLHIKPCVCRRTFQQDGIRVPAGRDCHVVPGKHGPLRFWIKGPTGMSPRAYWDAWQSLPAGTQIPSC